MFILYSLTRIKDKYLIKKNYVPKIHLLDDGFDLWIFQLKKKKNLGTPWEKFQESSLQVVHVQRQDNKPAHIMAQHAKGINNFVL